MTHEASSQTAPRARAVADLPLAGLIDRAEELARAWAVALILGRPPGAIAEVPLEDLARDAPRACAQVLRALQSDAELQRLIETPGDGAREEPASAPALASLAGASDVASVVAAVEALRGVLWEALLAELRRPVFDRADAHLLADLADRLAYVCAMALAAALPAAPRDAKLEGRSDVIVAGTESAAAEPPREPAGAEHPGGEVVIVDERPQTPSSARVVVAREAPSAADEDEEEEQEGAPATFSEGPPPGAPEPHVRRERSPEVERAGPQVEIRDEAEVEIPDAAEVEVEVRNEPRIEIRDERVEEGPAAWIRSIGRELERFAHDRRPFAVLLVELMDVEGLQLFGEVLSLSSQLERALRLELPLISERPAASLTREAPGRFWLLAPGIDGLRVRALAEQIAHAVRRSVKHRGRPLEVAIGTAVCPDNGLQAAALAAHADVALYAARADGSARDGSSR